MLLGQFTSERSKAAKVIAVKSFLHKTSVTSEVFFFYSNLEVCGNLLQNVQCTIVHSVMADTAAINTAKNQINDWSNSLFRAWEEIFNISLKMSTEFAKL